MNFVEMLKRRLREPSSWAGFGLIMSQAAQAVATRDPMAIASVVGGIVSVLVPEGGVAQAKPEGGVSQAKQ